MPNNNTMNKKILPLMKNSTSVLVARLEGGVRSVMVAHCVRK